MTDSILEHETRHLLGAAAAGLPDGGDLTAQVQRRVAARRRRTRAAISATGIGAVAAVAGALLTAGPAVPSAYAAVTAAAAATDGQSFELAVANTYSYQGRVTGSPSIHARFDLAKGIGEYDNGRQLWAGGYIYHALRPESVDGKTWEKMQSPLELPILGLRVAVGRQQQYNVSPQSLFGLLRAAADVHQTGTIAQGWTEYAFTEPGSHITITGTVAVDGQGLVRQLSMVLRPQGIDPATGERTTTVLQAQADFSDFGIPVSVTVPPDSECLIETGTPTAPSSASPSPSGQ